jgi:hypothetical protein
MWCEGRVSSAAASQVSSPLWTAESRGYSDEYEYGRGRWGPEVACKRVKENEKEEKFRRCGYDSPPSHAPSHRPTTAASSPELLDADDQLSPMAQMRCEWRKRRATTMKTRRRRVSRRKRTRTRTRTRARRRRRRGRRRRTTSGRESRRVTRHLSHSLTSHPSITHNHRCGQKKVQDTRMNTSTGEMGTRGSMRKSERERGRGKRSEDVATTGQHHTLLHTVQPQPPLHLTCWMQMFNFRPWRRCDGRGGRGGRRGGGGGDASHSPSFSPLPSLHHTQSPQGDTAEVGAHLVVIKPGLFGFGVALAMTCGVRPTRGGVEPKERWM